MLNQILDTLDIVDPLTGIQNDLILLVNNLGHISEFEQGIFLNDCVDYLTREKSYKVKRIAFGNFYSSIESKG